jgi:hypothetical protein
LTSPYCLHCGSSLEPDMVFCPSCGQNTAAPAGVAGTAQGPWAPPMGPGPGYPPTMGMSPYPVMFRPYRNPLQSASVSAGVLMLIAGIFGLIFGTMLLVYDAFDQMNYEDGGSTSVLRPVPFFLAAVYLFGFVLSIVGCYGCFRLMRFEFALLAPLVLMIAYFLGLLYEPFILFVTVEILILSIISLALVAYARPVFANPLGART